MNIGFFIGGELIAIPDLGPGAPAVSIRTMPTRILLIRAVNVGPAQLPMAELREILEQLGATEVRTYIASGNAIANVPGDPDAFDRAVEHAVQQKYGWFREVMSRTPDELRLALDAHPFAVETPKFSYIAPLTATPSAKKIDDARGIATGKDEWQLVGHDLHIKYDDGAGRADLDFGKLLKTLGVQGTARNMNTIKKLIELAASDE